MYNVTTVTITQASPTAGGSTSPTVGTSINLYSFYDGSPYSVQISCSVNPGYRFHQWDLMRSGSVTQEYNASFTQTWEYNVTWIYVFCIFDALISFDKVGGTGGNDSVYFGYSTDTGYWYYQSITPPTKAGAVFLGYFTAQTGGSQVYYASGAPVNTGKVGPSENAPKTLYAHWETLITVGYHGNGGTPELQSVSYHEGDTYGSGTGMPSVTRSGCTFSGWFTAASGGTQKVSSDTVSSSITALYAHWKVTVSFNTNGSPSSVAPVDKDVGDTYGTLPTSPPVMPPELGQSLVGWFTLAAGGVQIASTDVVNASITIYAHWTASIVITFDANGGTSSEASRTYNTGDVYGALPTATRTGYSFVGWFTLEGTSVSPSHTVPNESTTLYAHWNATSCVLTFDANGGTSPIASLTVPYGSQASLPVPTYSGHSFVGWFTSGGVEVTSATTITSSMTLYARWSDSVLIGWWFVSSP